MLSQVLDKLASWVSTYFLVSYFFPVLTFTCFHIWMLSRVCPWVHESIAGIIGSAPNSVSTLVAAPAALIGVAILAYIYSALGAFLREILEGSRLPDWVRFRLTRSKLKQYHDLSDTVRSTAQMRSQMDGMSRELEASLSRSSLAQFSAQAASMIMELTAKAKSQLDKPPAIPLQEMNQALILIVAELDGQPGRPPGYRWLKEVGRLKFVMGRATQILATRQGASEVLLQYRYPDDPSEIGATGMGNIVASMGSYATTRYQIDLETFWPRMQGIVQGKKELFDALQQSKAQLDFLVTMCWMTIFAWAVWLPLMAFFGSEPWLFLGLGALGPVLTLIWYHLAIVSYTGFAAQVRGAIDLCRLDFLKEMRLPMPLDLIEERRIWSRVGTFVKFGKFDNLPGSQQK